ncbi:NAD(P)H-binding protein [Streptacidiphilus sp. P02-A3a]|uniref:NAD(P)H-binding protein n=1 Tax=Streptacidiphilus sp. P02-A3a TaxID=2704468 RepID=UPI0015FC5D24|nr:NAD(P)H-binding protein [Streptacidiphilus sp. P02-A3a]QMU67361.1 NAD(P)H-binding protein [Streptacidiphilus sp. P02-A3a]
MIVVTTPTGAVGRRVLTGVLDAGEQVRVIARNPSRLPFGVRDRVEVVPGSHRDAEVVDRAFDGAEAVFWLVPPDPAAAVVDEAFTGFTRAACAAFVRRGVRRVVGVSALGRGFTASAGLATASLAMDDLITGTGVDYRALTMPAFMENLLGQAALIRERGEFYSLIDGDRRLPTVAARDVAAAATGLLLDRDWHGQGEVPLLGPEDLSFHRTAAVISEVVGRPVQYRQLSAEAFRAVMTGVGMSEAMALATAEMLLAKNRGLDELVPRTAESATPTHFRSWCAEVLRPALAAADNSARLGIL